VISTKTIQYTALEIRPLPCSGPGIHVDVAVADGRWKSVDGLIRHAAATHGNAIAKPFLQRPAAGSCALVGR